MQELKQKVSAWWRGLTEQEQKLLTLLAPILLVTGLYWSLWQPLMSAVEQSEQALVAETNNVRLMKVSANDYLAQKKAQPNTRQTGSLSQMVNRSAPRHGLTVARLQPQSDRLSVSLEDASFEALLNWLHELSTQHGIKADVMDISASNEQGMVQVRRLQLVQG